jgi:endonuclease/exonuclease/phosphatase family metal-dependent hydrolase
MFVSADFHVEQCDYLHRLRALGCSDHSALSASLTFDCQSSRRTGQPGSRC